MVLSFFFKFDVMKEKDNTGSTSERISRKFYVFEKIVDISKFLETHPDIQCITDVLVSSSSEMAIIMWKNKRGFHHEAYYRICKIDDDTWGLQYQKITGTEYLCPVTKILG